MKLENYIREYEPLNCVSFTSKNKKYNYAICFHDCDNGIDYTLCINGFMHDGGYFDNQKCMNKFISNLKNWHK